MDENNCNYYIFNEIIIEATFLEEVITSKGITLYEVIRVMEGVPLFIEEHLNRLVNSAKLTKLKLKYSNEEIRKLIKILIEKNGITEGNIKIIFNYNGDDNFYAYFIEHKYPDPKMYVEGVETIFYHGERENPNAKVINSTFRKNVNERITEAGVFEAILVDNNGNITEGSKSNIFMIKGDNVITAPIEGVLPGVTRDRIIDLLKKLNFKISEKNVNYKELLEMDALFITGTSPKVLPINRIDQNEFDSAENKILIKIIVEYDRLIRNYINNNKNVR